MDCYRTEIGIFYYCLIPGHDGGHRVLVCASREDIYNDDWVDSFLASTRSEVIEQLAWLLTDDAFQTESDDLGEVADWWQECILDFWSRHAAKSHSHPYHFVPGSIRPHPKPNQ